MHDNGVIRRQTNSKRKRYVASEKSRDLRGDLNHEAELRGSNIVNKDVQDYE